MMPIGRALLCAIILSTLGCHTPEPALPQEQPTTGPQSSAPLNKLSATEAAAGWQLLFNGASMEHFRNYNAEGIDSRWIIDNQSIVLTARGGGDLITRDAWSDFEFKLDWWVSAGGNSGIFFLADESDLPIFVHAPEVQILDNERHSDRKQTNRRSGSLYDMIAAPAAAQKPAEQWNSVTIRHAGGRLQVWQNAVQTIDIKIGGKSWGRLVADSKFKDWPGFGENTRGHLGLQDHGDRVAFRNIKVRAL